MRLFIALDLSEAVCSTLARSMSWLRDFYREIKIVPPENYHITVQFLGSVPDGRLDEIRKALRRIKVEPLELKLSGWGMFPNKTSPNVFWAGVEETSGLAPLVQDCQKAMAALGFAADEKEFHAHVTLARAGQGAVPKAFLQRWRSMAPLAGDTAFTVAKLTLYESKTLQSGPVYSALA